MPLPAQPPGVLQDRDLRLRPFTEADRESVTALLAEPEVLRWWGDGEFDHEHGLIAEVAGRPVGWIEYTEDTSDCSPSVRMDIALTTALHGRGYGRRMLHLLIEHFASKGHHRFTIDPKVQNTRAIRCYAAAGFRPVGVLRAYERDPCGGWSDGLLMDLIVHDDKPFR